MFTDKQVEQLAAKLDVSNVKSRSQAGRSLSYIEGWHAIAEANRIFGFDGWERHLQDLRQVCEPYQDAKELWRVAYVATVRVAVWAGERVVTRDGTGYGSGIDRDLGSAHESAVKEAETDAMKRALMSFGNQFGLALYDKTQEGVDRGQPNNDHRGPSKSDADWKLVAEDLKTDFAGAIDVIAVNELLDSKRFKDLEAYSKTAASFLRKIAENRRAALAQKAA